MPPHPRDGRALLGHLGAHTPTTPTTFSVPDSVFDGSNCGSGVVRLWSQHPQHPGSPWGIGENVSTLQGWQGTAWSPWKGTQTQPQPHSALPTTAFDGSNRKVVCTSSLASRVAMGHLGQQYFTPGMAGHCLVTLLGRPHSPHHERPRRCRHCTQRFELPLGVCPSMMCMPSSTAWAAMGH